MKAASRGRTTGTSSSRRRVVAFDMPSSGPGGKGKSAPPRPHVGFEEAVPSAVLTDALGRQVAAAPTDDRTLLPELCVSLGLVKVGFRYVTCLERPSLDASVRDAKDTIESVRVDNPLDADVSARVLTNDPIEEEEEEEKEEDELGHDEGKHLSSSSSFSSGKVRVSKKHYTPRGICEISLAARRAGKVKGRFTLEVCVRLHAPAGVKKRRAGRSRAEASAAASDASSKLVRFVIPVVVTGTVMGRDKGTPQLREAVHCVGRLVEDDSSDADTAFVPFKYYQQEEEEEGEGEEEE